jgi:F0F1-type ATP synthase assembly protein I
MELPFIPVAGVIIAGGIGYWLDARFGSSPLLTLLLGAVGFAAGVREVLRRIPRDDAGDALEETGQPGADNGADGTRDDGE